ncbi:MAG: hypothetical protein JST80_03945 [Bdellovibrionales bacterium]|nr:hypothetical protein [Bdellovibrionales bacterium]
MKNLVLTFAVMTSFSALAEDIGKDAAAILTKSGSFATCSIEGREVEDAIKAISAAYSGKFSVALTTQAYGGGSSMKACLILNARN